mmetsp:Transcript_27310/g.79974  ORF Transcript_27310/g.79974 Transcript_27310/m.79974 type:complete len:99 (-) Transcript_27310:18-314(-)
MGKIMRRTGRVSLEIVKAVASVEPVVCSRRPCGSAGDARPMVTLASARKHQTRDFDFFLLALLRGTCGTTGAGALGNLSRHNQCWSIRREAASAPRLW